MSCMKLLIAASMPSGVEHPMGSVMSVLYRARLIAASMPSGVEHESYRSPGRRCVRLIAASMPSGVEHSLQPLGPA